MLAPALFFLHMGIAEIGGGQEGLLDGARAEPAQEVEVASGLVVGARLARAAKGLLPDHGPGGLVVDVEIACCIAQGRQCLHCGIAVLAEDGAREAVG